MCSKAAGLGRTSLGDSLGGGLREAHCLSDAQNAVAPQKNEPRLLSYPNPKSELGMDEGLRSGPAVKREGAAGRKRLDVGLIDDFLEPTPNAKATKAEINRWDHIKLKSLRSKGHHQQTGGSLQNGRYLQTVSRIRG